MPEKAGDMIMLGNYVETMIIKSVEEKRMLNDYEMSLVLFYYHEIKKMSKRDSFSKLIAYITDLKKATMDEPAPKETEKEVSNNE